MSVLFHTTSKSALAKIRKLGYIEPRLDRETYVEKISFTSDPYVGEGIRPFGYTLVFPEELIRGKYGGRDTDFPIGTRASHFGESEVEVEVPVSVLDAMEVLPVGEAMRKYGSGQELN